MLSKVMKYENRALGRTILPFLGAGLALALVLRGLYTLLGLVWQPAQSVAGILFSTIGMLAATFLIFLALALTVMRFYQSMAGAEGYLTFTLPVKPSTHIWGRGIVSTLYLCAAALGAVAVALISVPGLASGARAYLQNPTVSFSMGTQSQTVAISSGQVALCVALVVFFTVFTFFTSLFQLYAAIALGTQLGKSRAFGAVLAYIVLSTVESIACLPLLAIPAFAVLGFDISGWNTKIAAWFAGPAEQAAGRAMDLLLILLAIAAAITLVFTVVHYIVTKRYFTSKLNLE